MTIGCCNNNSQASTAYATSAVYWYTGCLYKHGLKTKPLSQSNECHGFRRHQNTTFSARNRCLKFSSPGNILSLCRDNQCSQTTSGLQCQNPYNINRGGACTAEQDSSSSAFRWLLPSTRTTTWSANSTSNAFKLCLSLHPCTIMVSPSLVADGSGML